MKDKDTGAWMNWPEDDGKQEEGRGPIVPEDVLELLTLQNVKGWHIRGTMYGVNRLAVELGAQYFGDVPMTEDVFEAKHPGYMEAFHLIVAGVGARMDWREEQPVRRFYEQDERRTAVRDIIELGKDEDAFQRRWADTLATNEALVELVASAHEPYSEDKQREFDLGVVHAIWACEMMLPPLADDRHN